MPDPAPRFSVVIPAFNEEASIGACLKALASQDFLGAVELVVVDNASTDATSAVALAHGARVIREPRQGIMWAREAGRRAACGELVVSTDADTTVPPGWLSAIDQAWREHPDAALIAGPCRYVDEPRWGAWFDHLLFGAVAAIHRQTGRVLYVTATNLSFRREQFDGYDTRMTQGADEWGVLNTLKQQGDVIWLAHNSCQTSARRLQHGLLRSLVVDLGFHYLLTYQVNRIAGRSVLGLAPAIRPASSERSGAFAVRNTGHAKGRDNEACDNQEAVA